MRGEITLSPAESRQRLTNLRRRALDAGLSDVVHGVDIRLAIAAQLATLDLEKALANTIGPDQPAQGAQEPLAPAQPRKPTLPGRASPRSFRQPTGPDRWDEEIPV
ncbi:hypothetical protein [Bosea vestrisii]|uniref:Uncharacterized protein n=1 Tax=Bosea vestrisii TaxID=151416 RepID=A0ABW0HF02_9HYPH